MAEIPAKQLDPTVLKTADITDTFIPVRSGASWTDVDPATLGGGLPVGAMELTAIWSDVFNQSRNAAALASAGYVLNLPGSGSIVEDGTSLTITTPSAYNANWYDATRTCENLALTINKTLARNVLILSSVRFPATVNQTGVGMVVEWATTDWYRITHTRASGASRRDSIRSPTTGTYDAADGGAEGWVGLAIIGNYAYPVSLIQNWASGIPAVADLDFLHEPGTLTPTLRGDSFTVRLINISYDPSAPGGAVEFGGLYIYRMD